MIINIVTNIDVAVKQNKNSKLWSVHHRAKVPSATRLTAGSGDSLIVSFLLNKGPELADHDDG